MATHRSTTARRITDSVAGATLIVDEAGCSPRQPATELGRDCRRPPLAARLIGDHSPAAGCRTRRPARRAVRNGRVVELEQRAPVRACSGRPPRPYCCDPATPRFRRLRGARPDHRWHRSTTHLERMAGRGSTVTRTATDRRWWRRATTMSTRSTRPSKRLGSTPAHLTPTPGDRIAGGEVAHVGDVVAHTTQRPAAHHHSR